jgi:hypothetical protein
MHKVCFIVVKKSSKIPNGYSEPVIDEGQTTQWPKEIAQKDKQRSTNHLKIAQHEPHCIPNRFQPPSCLHRMDAATITPVVVTPVVKG